MRSERMPKIFHKLAADFAKHRCPVDYDAAQPWTSVFAYIVDHDEKWWTDHLVDPCRDVRYGGKKSAEYVDGDVSTGSTATHTATGSDTMTPLPSTIINPVGAQQHHPPTPTGPPRPGKRPRTSTTVYHNIPQVMGSTSDFSVFDGSKWTSTKHGLRFCEGFQTGSCCEK